MLKVFMFPGFDALDALDNRLRCLDLVTTQKYIQQAQALLDSERAPSDTIENHMRKDLQQFNADVGLKCLSSFVCQIGIFEHLLSAGYKPDMLVGCSLGDLARTVAAGIVDFDSMALGAYDFGQHAAAHSAGAIYRCSSTEPFARSEITELLPKDLTLAVYQTPRHFLVSGPETKAEAWLQRQSARLGWRHSKYFDIPIHSELMRPSATAMGNSLERASVSKPKVRTFSAVTMQEISDGRHVRAELTRNIRGCVDWVQAAKTLVKDFQPSEFVSVGPASTLLHFCTRIDESSSVKMTDGFSSLVARA